MTVSDLAARADGPEGMFAPRVLRFG